MIQFTKEQRQRLAALQQSKDWDIFVHFCALLTDVWQNEPVKSHSQFETTWRTAQREAKVEAVKKILELSMEEASK